MLWIFSDCLPGKGSGSSDERSPFPPFAHATVFVKSDTQIKNTADF